MLFSDTILNTCLTTTQITLLRYTVRTANNYTCSLQSVVVTE